MQQSAIRTLVFSLLLTAPAFAQTPPQNTNQTGTTLLVDVDHRPAISLDGEWHTIIDQYSTGIYTLHQELRKDGFS